MPNENLNVHELEGVAASDSGRLADEIAVEETEQVAEVAAIAAEAEAAEDAAASERAKAAADDETIEGVTPIIFLDDISVTFKTRTGSLFNPNKVKAVQHLSLKLNPGETIGIVGESGCGKSTTANVMCGLQQPTEGRVFFKGEDVTKRSAAQRKLIGRVISVVFQDPATALNARMSIHDQLMDPMNVHSVGSSADRDD